MVRANHPYRHPIDLHLQPAEIHALAVGDGIGVHPDHGHPSRGSIRQRLHLKESQMKAIINAHKKGKTYRLRMSVPQKDHHAVVGAGFFGKLWQGIKDGAKTIWNDVVKPAGRNAISTGLDAAEAAIPSNLHGLSGPIRKMIREKTGFGLADGGACKRKTGRRKL